MIRGCPDIPDDSRRALVSLVIAGLRSTIAAPGSVNASNQPAQRAVAAWHFVCDSSVMTMLRPFCLILALCLPGCYLVDQRTFDANAGKKPEPPVAASPPVHAVPALVTIVYRTPNPDYHDILTNAVRKALALKPDVLFSVAALIPPAGGPDKAIDEGALAATSSREVAQVIVDAGAQPGQIEQFVSVNPTIAVREVVVGVH